MHTASCIVGTLFHAISEVLSYQSNTVYESHYHSQFVLGLASSTPLGLRSRNSDRCWPERKKVETGRSKVHLRVFQLLIWY